MRAVSTPGSIALTQWGTAGARVVLVHGGVQGSRARGAAHFRAQQALAAQGYQVLVPDRPGHGESPAPGRPDDAEADAGVVLPLLGERAHLVGHSFGGAVALAAAARHPASVSSLTLIEPGLQAVALNHLTVLRFVARLVFAQKWPGTDAARLERFATLMRIPPGHGGATGDAVEEAAMGRAMAALRPPARGAVLRELEVIRGARVPLLVVTGGWSAAVDLTGEAVARLGGGAHELVACPHHFPQDQPAFNERLVRFFEGLS